MWLCILEVPKITSLKYCCIFLHENKHQSFPQTGRGHSQASQINQNLKKEGQDEVYFFVHR